MPKYKVGDTVWYAKCRWESVSKTCPTCYGKTRVTLILGNGDSVILPCHGCAPGFQYSTGKIQEYEYVVEAMPVTITGMRVEIKGEAEKVDYTSSFYSYPEEDLFPTEQEAAEKAKEKKAQLDEDQSKRAESIKKNVRKSFSWNAHYHLSEAKKNRKQAEYHDKMAVICKARTKEGTNG